MAFDLTTLLSDSFAVIRDLQPLPFDRASWKAFILRVGPDAVDLVADAIGADKAKALCAACASGELTQAHIDAAIDAAAPEATPFRDWLKSVDWLTLVKTYGPAIIAFFLKTAV